MHSRVREIGNDSHNGSCSCIFHAGDGKHEFHQPIVNLLIFKGLDDEYLVATDLIQQPHVDFSVLKAKCFMLSEGDVQVGDDFIAEHSAAKGENLEVCMFTLFR